MTKKPIPLDDLEMFDLLKAAYPEKFPDDEDTTWEAAQAFAEEINGRDAVADLLGRVTTLAMPMQSPLTGGLYHCLGEVQIVDGKANMVAAVTRPAT